MKWNDESKRWKIESAEEIRNAIEHAEHFLPPMTKSLKNTVFTMVNAVRDQLAFGARDEFQTMVENVARTVYKF